MRVPSTIIVALPITLASFAFSQAQTAPLPVADLVLVHGKVWTGSPAMPEAESVAVSGETILAAGASDAMLKLAAPGATIVELNGRRVLPGFNDAHVHLTWGGEQLVSVHLTDASSQAEFRARIAAFAKTAPEGAWIVHGSWDHERWTPVALPTHQLIDDVTPDNPVAVTRTDGHMLLANALAKRLAGIDSGATVAFGSDWPVAPLSPLIGIYAAVTRRTIDGKNPNGWQPQQEVTVAEAVKAYTYGAAYAEGEEQVKGTLEPGKLADIIVLAEDIFSIDPIRIQDVKVDSTYLGGQLIYQRDASPAKP